jgi:hypothetical protein
LQAIVGVAVVLSSRRTAQAFDLEDITKTVGALFLRVFCEGGSPRSRAAWDFLGDHWAGEISAAEAAFLICALDAALKRRPSTVLQGPLHGS